MKNIEIRYIYEFLKTNMKCSIEYGNNNESTIISELIKLDSNNVENDKLFWVSHKYLNTIHDLTSGILIAPMDTNLTNFIGTLIKCEFPRRAFSLILKEYFILDDTPGPTILGIGTVCEENVKIGKNCTIGYNNVILNGTSIGDNVKIGNNNTIGGVGFGYEKDEAGIWQSIPHIGNVVIEDSVEIGNNNCIDRAVLGSTLLKRMCKVDNLTHISHGCIIGENALIIANSVLCGSSEVGDNTWVAPSTVILNGKKIGKNCMTGLGSVVIKDVDDNTLVAGVPAKKLKEI